MVLVLKPSAQELTDEIHDKLHAAVVSRWKRVVHLGVLLFLVTGFYNYVQAVPKHKEDALYHGLLGTKMLLAFGVFFLASALVGRSPKLEPIRKNRGRWLKVLIAMAITIISISGFVKVRLYETPPTQAPQQVSTFASEAKTP